MTAQNPLTKLAQKINLSERFFVLLIEKNYLITGVWEDTIIRIEKSGNIFQPFGKNLNKKIPLFFPVGFLSNKKAFNKDKFIEQYHSNFNPKLLLHKSVLNICVDELEWMLENYVCSITKDSL